MFRLNSIILHLIDHVYNLWYVGSWIPSTPCVIDSLAEAIWAALPTTNRGRPTILSADAKGERLAYAVRYPRPFAVHTTHDLHADLCSH